MSKKSSPLDRVICSKKKTLYATNEVLDPKAAKAGTEIGMFWEYDCGVLGVVCAHGRKTRRYSLSTRRGRVLLHYTNLSALLHDARSRFPKANFGRVHSMGGR